MGATAFFCMPILPAHADPISAAILSVMTGATWGATAGATAVLAQVLVGNLIAALPGFLLTAAIGVGATLLANALRPQPNQQVNDPGSRIVNLRQTIQDRSKSYGRVRTGGPVAFWKLAGGKRYVAVMFNTGEIDAIESTYLNEFEVSMNEYGLVSQTEFWSGGNSMVAVSHFNGTPGQIAPPLLSGTFPEWTSAHRLTGIAGAVMVCQNPKPEDFAKVYPSGREPTISSVYRASKVYDPRDGSQTLGVPSTYKWTTNAALIIADWITSPDGYGQGVDWAEVADEADVADTPMRTRSGHWLPKWQLCGTYYFSQTREEVRKNLAIACDAWFYDRVDGKVGFKLGRWMEPAVTITADHINSIKVGEGQDGEIRNNALSIEYVEPAAGYRQYPSAAVTITDGEPYNQATTAAHWIPNHTQACAVAKRTLLAMRADTDVTMNLKLYGLLLMPADGDDRRTFRLEYPDLGISHVYELADWSLAPDGMSVNVTGRATQQSDWAFDGLEDEPEPSNISDVDVVDDVPDPENVTIASPSPGELYVDFEPPPRLSLLMRVRYRKISTADWFEFGVASSQSYLSITGLTPGDAYEAQVQFRTATANASNWVASTPTSIEISAP